MDEVVKRVLLSLSALGLVMASSHAQPLQDPTRPAFGADTGATERAATPRASGPQLQTVLLGRGPGARQLAIIDGATVRVGDTVRGARVARIEANQVELVRGNARQILQLEPRLRAGAMQIERTGKQ